VVVYYTNMHFTSHGGLANEASQEFL